MNVFIILIALAPVLTGFTFIEQTSDWKLEKNKKGIKIYTRELQGSEYKEVKAVTNIKTSLSSLVAALKDVPSHTSWIYNCEEGKILKQISETEQYCYTISDAPWPAENRDVVYSFTINQDAATKTVITTSTGMPEYIPPESGLTRVYEFKTSWIFTPGQDSIINVQYQAHVDRSEERRVGKECRSRWSP